MIARMPDARKVSPMCFQKAKMSLFLRTRSIE